MDKLSMYIGTLNNANTKRNYGNDIRFMLEYVGKDEKDITLADLLAWKTDMVNSGLSTATIARRIGTIRRYFTFLYDMELIDSNPSRKLKAPKIVNKVEPTLTKDDVNMMLDCGKNPRDKAIMAMLASTGMRISELISIKLDDFDGDDISIVGKGNKRRLVHINEKTMHYLEDYLKVRKDGVDNLFVSNQHTPMRPEAINEMLKKSAERAGVDKNVHNHSFRHMFATCLLDNSVPIEQIQLCMGHSDISVTTRYARIRNERDVIRNVMDMEVF